MLEERGGPTPWPAGRVAGPGRCRAAGIATMLGTLAARDNARSSAQSTERPRAEKSQGKKRIVHGNLVQGYGCRKVALEGEGQQGGFKGGEGNGRQGGHSECLFRPTGVRIRFKVVDRGRPFWRAGLTRSWACAAAPTRPRPPRASSPPPFPFLPTHPPSPTPHHFAPPCRSAAAEIAARLASRAPEMTSERPLH